ncbi:hypothetical protein CWI48_07700, partial [Neisseria meningitidis]
FTAAFNPEAVLGGAAGIGMRGAISFGGARGVFFHEGGGGVAPPAPPPAGGEESLGAGVAGGFWWGFL